MAESFTSKQKEIVARKMGYDGPMQMFDEFLSASPSDAQKYSAITSKFVERMAKGGVVVKAPVKKFAAGGAAISDEEIKNYIAANQGMSDKQVAAKMDELGLSVDQIARGYGLSGNEVQARYDAVKAPPVSVVKKDDVAGKVTTTASTADTTVGAPNVPGATSYTAAQTGTPTAAVATNIGVLKDATVTKVDAPTDITAPAKITTTDATAASAAEGVKAEMDKLKAAEGVVSEKAKVVAEETKPAETAIKDVTAAQGTAAQAIGAPTRSEVTGEMVSGSAVDAQRVKDTLDLTKAEQGTVTEDMTVQGQLNKLLKNFDAGTPPPWAAASMRAANAQMAARGLGASSMAGQAIIQATLEAATPLAAADAKVFETMGLQNLSNRQQTAILVAQQRAAFLGQDFDQAFQTRVLNAAKVADIANRNFDAQTQVVLENARLTNSMNIAQLSASNAVVLAKAAQMSSLETQNLNNRQQAAVENAKAFLTMDLRNVEMKQQTALFKAQEIADSLLSDAALSNAVRITNAANKLEADKISETLTLTANQFNATEKNKIAMINASAANETARFNTLQGNERAQFNAANSTQISLANAKLLAEVSVANTAATNAANAVNAKNATDLSAATYAQQSQTYRDLLEQSWKTGEAVKDRATEIVKSTLVANASITASSNTANAAATGAIGGAAVKLLSSDTVWKAAEKMWDKLTSSSNSTVSDSNADD